MYVVISIIVIIPLPFLRYLFLAPIEKGSKLEAIVVGIRTRKGLKVSILLVSMN